MLRKLLAVVFVAAAACRRDAPPSRPNVVLISIDTLRSDHLPAYGYRAISAPAIDRLASDAIVFEHAFSQVPLTLPSHVSIFTGLLPAHHGVRDNAGFVLDPKIPTIASVLHANGYATAGAASAYVLRASTNAGSGFDVWNDDVAFVEGAPTGNLARDGRATLQVLQQWIASQHDRPFFAFLHLFEPHAPYEPSYDGEITKADALVGQLLDSMRSAGTYDDALIILLSDHGEGLRDHGEQEHGVLLYREALQVPLIVKLPRNDRRGSRVGEVAQLIDVLPTIAAVTGAAAPHTDGRSLLASGAPRAAFAETIYPRIHFGWSDLRSVVDWPHHLIDGPHPELYDASSDPHELRDVRSVDRRAYAQLQRDLVSAPATAVAAPRVAPEEARKLAALGYLSAQRPVAASALNPRDHLRDLDALATITRLMAERRFADAAREIESVLARNPGWSDLRDDLGVCYEHMGDLPRAEETYREAIRTTPELASEFALSLAGVLLERGALDDAAAHARVAMRTNPTAAHEVLARIALARGDTAVALDEARLAGSSFLTAQIHLSRNDPRSALTILRGMYDESQSSHASLPRGYFVVLGDTFLRLGMTEDARRAYTHAAKIHPEDPVPRARLRSF